MEALLPTVIDEKDLPVDPIATLPFDELIRVAQQTEDPPAARWAQIEAQRRVALGAAALPFGLLAIGLALGRRDISRSGGTVMGLVGAIAYYALVQLAEGLLRDESAPVALVVGFRTWFSSPLPSPSSITPDGRHPNRIAAAAEARAAFSRARVYAAGCEPSGTRCPAT